MQLEYEEPPAIASPSVRIALPEVEQSPEPEEEEEGDEGEVAAEQAGEQTSFPLDSISSSPSASKVFLSRLQCDSAIPLALIHHQSRPHDPPLDFPSS